MQNSTKRRILDGICAFVIATAFFACVALVTQADFFASAVKWDAEGRTLELFDVKFTLDESIPRKLNTLLSANDLFTFDGFSDILLKVGSLLWDYIKDTAGLLYTAVRGVVGGL